MATRTLGYPTRTAAVQAMRSAGLSTGEIAQRIGIEPKTVVALEISAARKRVNLAMPIVDPGRMVLLPHDVLAGLRRPAQKRGITPNHLARLIIEAVIDGHIVDAVLDDAEADYAPLRRGRVNG